MKILTWFKQFKHNIFICKSIVVIVQWTCRFWVGCVFIFTQKISIMSCFTWIYNSLLLLSVIKCSVIATWIRVCVDDETLCCTIFEWLFVTYFRMLNRIDVKKNWIDLRNYLKQTASFTSSMQDMYTFLSTTRLWMTPKKKKKFMRRLRFERKCFDSINLMHLFFYYYFQHLKGIFERGSRRVKNDCGQFLYQR